MQSHSLRLEHFSCQSSFNKCRVRTTTNIFHSRFCWSIDGFSENLSFHSEDSITTKTCCSRMINLMLSDSYSRKQISDANSLWVLTLIIENINSCWFINVCNSRDFHLFAKHYCCCMCSLVKTKRLFKKTRMKHKRDKNVPCWAESSQQKKYLKMLKAFFFNFFKNFTQIQIQRSMVTVHH